MTKQQGAPFGSRRHDCRCRRRHDEWPASIKPETITDDGESRISRRYSASHATSFREEEEEEDEDNKTVINHKSSASSRSNFTISSTVSSPGYNFKEEIDLSSYSFSSALGALQGRRWEGTGRGEGLALNSKWNEAEKYICNPLSGEVPVECLSANTRLRGGRSFRSSDRLTTRRGRRSSMSAPLFYPPKPHNLLHHPHQPHHHLLLGIITDKNPAAPGIPNNMQKGEKMATTCHHHHHLIGSKTSRNCSPAAAAPTPSNINIQESSPVIMRTHSHPSSSSTAKVQSHEEKREEIKGESRKEEAAEITGKNELGEKGKQETAAESEELRRRRPGGGCLLWRRFLWMRKRERDKEKLRGPTKIKNSHCSKNIFLCPIHQW